MNQYILNQDANGETVDTIINEGGHRGFMSIKARISRIEVALETDMDLSQNRVMILAGEWKALNEELGKYDEGMWAMLHRLRGI